jgi:predicted exporter
VKPRGLPSLEAQEGAIRLASGERAATALVAEGAHEVQLVVTQRAPASEETSLLSRGDALANRLAAPGRTVESLGAWLPSQATIRARVAERDALDLPAKADALAKVLDDEGFNADGFAPALDHLRHASTVDDAIAAAQRLREGPLAPLVARHLARDPEDGSLVLATYVRGTSLDPDALAREAAEVDRDAVVTGYPILERSLRTALATDLPRVAIVALVLVIIALRAVLQSFREVVVALVALFAELVVVALIVRAAHVPMHVYDALVIPVLIGITVDESMFLLYAIREGDVAHALRAEGRAVVTTACTTAAGFAALLTCGFPGLRDLGAVGLIGTLAGLLASLAVVPAMAKLLRVGRS